MKYFIKYRRYDLVMQEINEGSEFVNTDDLEKWWESFEEEERNIKRIKQTYCMQLLEVVPLPELTRRPNTGPM